MAVEQKILKNETKMTAAIMFIMKNLNFMVIIFIGSFMCISTYGIINEGSAREFMLGIARIQSAPWKIATEAFIGLILLMIIMNIKKRSIAAVVFLSIAELTVAAWLIYITGFAYTGLIFLIFADYMKYLRTTRLIYAMLGAALIVYVLINSELLSGLFGLVPFSYYLSYYNSFARSFLLGIVSLSEGVNTLLFIAYMVFIIHGQTVENRQMSRLNEELNSVNEQLKEANVQLEENARQIENMTKIEERNRLAREIHDTLGHVLTGVITGIDACNELILIAPEVAKKQLEVIAIAARQGMTDVRRSVRALRPDALDKLPIEEAISKMITEMTLSTRVKINYENTANLTNLNEDEENVIYRIVQESITNAMRHGRADFIDIRIYSSEGHIIIKIKDNGIGCKNIKKGFGLSHMKERLDILGGELEYDGSSGFTVTAKIPKRIK